MSSLKEIVAKSKNAHFHGFQHGKFHYVTDCGFAFTIPVEDINGNSALAPHETAISLMKWIRKQLELVSASKE